MTGIEVLVITALGGVPGLIKKWRKRRAISSVELERLMAMQRIDQIRADTIRDLFEAERSARRGGDYIDATCIEEDSP